MIIEVGDSYKDVNGKKFVVVHLVQDLAGHNWVHYRNQQTGDEYSCWEESFLERFSKDISYSNGR